MINRLMKKQQKKTAKKRIKTVSFNNHHKIDNHLKIKFFKMSFWNQTTIQDGK